MNERINDIMNSSMEAGEVLQQLDDATEKLEIYEKTFPLFTKQALAERWGVDRQTVQNWSKRHIDFCEPVEGLVVGAGSYYPLYEVVEYEIRRGLKVNERKGV